MPGSALEAAREASKILIVSGYRRIAGQNGCPPSTMVSDEKIIEIYSRVNTAFSQAAEKRGENIPAVFVNRIVLKFLFVHEKMPAFFFDELWSSWRETATHTLTDSPPCPGLTPRASFKPH